MQSFYLVRWKRPYSKLKLKSIHKTYETKSGTFVFVGNPHHTAFFFFFFSTVFDSKKCPTFFSFLQLSIFESVQSIAQKPGPPLVKNKERKKCGLLHALYRAIVGLIKEIAFRVQCLHKNRPVKNNSS